MKGGRVLRKINTYSLFRLIIILFVVIGHSTYLSMASISGAVNYAMPENAAAVFSTGFYKVLEFLSSRVNNFHMPLFFMLSGAVYSLSSKNEEIPFNTLAAKKAERLVAPFFIYGLLFMLPMKLLGGYYTAETFPAAVRGFLIGDESGHLWFLTALFWCFMIFSLINRGLSRFGACATLFGCTLASIAYPALGDADFFGLRTGFSMLIWFALGYAFNALCYKKLASIKSWVLAVVAAAFGALLLFDMYYVFIPDLQLALCVAVFLLALCELASRIPAVADSSFLRMLERDSIYVYLFHDPLNFVILRFAFANWWVSDPVMSWVYVLARTLGVVVVSILLGELIGLLKRAVTKKHPGRENGLLLKSF